MQKKKLWTGILILAAAAFLIYFLTPRENVPAPSTRVILEHTQRTYIAPSCFEEAGATNFIEDSTLQNAKDLNYPPHSDCTEEAFQSNNDIPFVNLMKELGIMEKDSKDW